MRHRMIATAVVALTVGLLPSALAPPAGAWSKTLQYTCSGPGFGSAPSYTFAAAFETDVPDAVPYGSQRTVAWETHLWAPKAFHDWAMSEGYTTLYASADVGTAVDGVVQPEMRQSTAAIVIATSNPSNWTWTPTPTSGTVPMSTLGRHTLSVTSLELMVALHDDATGRKLATSATCTLDPVTLPADTVVDTYDVVAATTATSLAVSGETATATVTSNGTPPVGVVTFAVAGRSVAMDVTNGKAIAKLPTVPAGSHVLSATFVPSQPSQLTSSTATAPYAVGPTETTTTASAAYRAARHRVKARARVRTPGGDAVAGRVTFVLKRKGRILDNVTVRLSREGVAATRFSGVRRAGRHVVVARYLGSRAYQRSGDRVRLTIG